jgi:hypothetical protein
MKAGEPERYLFVITGEMRNTDMNIEPLGDDRITVGSRWGKTPVLCEGVSTRLQWHGVYWENVRCWTLDESGNRRQEISTRHNVDMSIPSAAMLTDAIIVTEPEHKTIWYEIEVRRPLFDNGNGNSLFLHNMRE